MEFHHFPIQQVGEEWTILFLIDEVGEGNISIRFSELEFFKSHEHNVLITISVQVGYINQEQKKIPGRSYTHRQRINILSASAVNGLSKQMADNYLNYNPNKIPFNIILNQSISALEDAFSKVSKTVSVSEIERRGERPDDLLGPLLAAGAGNLLFGDGGGAKSYFCLRTAISLVSGLPFLGFQPPKKTSVMYLDYEDDQWEFSTRTDELCSGMSPMPQEEDIRNIHYRKETVNLHDAIGSIRADIKRLDIGLLIIDSVGRACGAELENAEVANRYWNDINSLGITTLSIAHVAKGGVMNSDGETNLRGQKSAFGSVFFGNGARSAWNYVFMEEESPIVRACLYHRKSNRGRKYGMLPIEVDFRKENSVTVTHGNKDDWEEAMPLGKRVIKFLSTGMKTRDQLNTEFADAPKGSLRSALHRMVKAGQIEVLGGEKGDYFLPRAVAPCNALQGGVASKTPHATPIKY